MCRILAFLACFFAFTIAKAEVYYLSLPAEEVAAFNALYGDAEVVLSAEEICRLSSVTCRSADVSKHGASAIAQMHNIVSIWLPPVGKGGSVSLLGGMSKLERLSISGHSLSGDIGFITDLLHLKVAVLSGNSISGSIPDSIDNLIHLTELYLSNNSLTGSIPASIGNLPQLTYLNLSNNGLTGDIPEALGNLSRLSFLHLEGNALTGHIPNSLGQLSQLRYLRLAANQLTDGIPAALGNLVNLRELHLSSNQLTGDLPDSLGDLSHLKQLLVSDNLLNGNIPAALGNLTDLQDLRLDKNAFSGHLPDALGQLTNLVYFYFNDNQLTGNIPATFIRFDHIEAFNGRNNKLTGDIPAGFYAVWNDKDLDDLILLDNRALGGPLPAGFVTSYPALAADLRLRMSNGVFSVGRFGHLSCIPDTKEFTTLFAGTQWLQSACGEEESSCPEANTGPACLVGNPINIRTGVKQQSAIDYAAGNQSPLQLRRSYHSSKREWTFNITSQSLWINNRYVKLTGRSRSNYLFDCSSTTLPFQCSASRLIGQANTFSGYRLTQLADGYMLALLSGATESYDVAGKLTATTSAQGNTLSYSHDAASNQTTITDEFNRQIVLTLNPNNTDLVDQAVTPVGSFSYQYDEFARLITVTKPDGSTTGYRYDEANYSTVQYFANDGPCVGDDYLTMAACKSAVTKLGLLTGKIDAKGQRAASWYYDQQQRAYKSEHGAGADTTEIRFVSEQSEPGIDEQGNAIILPRVRDAIGPLGLRTRTTFRAPHNQRAEKIETFDTNDKLITTEYYSYDVNGFEAEHIDINGIKTQFSRDTDGREKSRIEYADTDNARVITTSYSGSTTKPTSITTPENRVVIGYINHNSGLLLSQQSITDVINNQQRTTSFSYNAAGQLMSIDGPRSDVNDITRFEYNAQGFKTKTTNALGHTTSVTAFNSFGQPITIIDENSVTTTLSYDLMGRVISSQRAGATEYFEYDLTGALIKSTLANGNVIQYEYDAAGRLTAIQDNAANRIEYQLDAAGNQLSTAINSSDGSLLQTQQRLFDQFNRLIKITNGTNNETLLSYLSNGQLDKTTDALANNTRNHYDSLQRLTEIHDPAEGKTAFSYDNAGRTTAITDATGKTTAYSYNGFGELTKQVSPDTGQTNRSYDSAGNLMSEIDARGITVSYQYDALNRVTQVSYPDSGENITFTYDSVANNNKGIGRLTGIVDASGHRQLRYGSQGQLLQETYMIAEQSYTSAYQYDSAGQLIGMTYPSGRQVDLTLNTQGQIKAISTTASVANTTAQTVLSDAAYLPFGPTRQFTHGNGLLNTLNYDQDYQLISQTLTGLKNQQLVYSATGNITAINQQDSNQTFAYDKLSRLVGATGEYGSLAYSYDAIGNRLSKTDNANSSNKKVANYHYREGSHHLGKITIGDVEQMNSLFSQFNQARRMSSVTNRQMITNYLYDSRGLRVSKTVPGSQIHYHYEPGGLLIGESNGQGIWQKEYLYFNAQLIAMIDYSGVGNAVTNDSAGQIYYAHNDHLGTPKLLTNSAAKPVWQASYTPFGLATINADVDNNGVAVTLNIRFPGQYYDAESGLHYNWFRYYDPAIGRYVTSDPIGLAGGINTYGYVGGNPVGFVDPRGLFGIDDVWAGVYWATGEWSPSQNTVNFSAGLGDGLLLGFGDDFRSLAGINGVNQCSSAYQYGGYVSFAAGGARLIYAGLVKGGSILASSGAAASAFRGRVKFGFRLGFGRNWRKPNLSKYKTDDALRQASGRSNKAINTYGAGVATASAADGNDCGCQR